MNTSRSIMKKTILVAMAAVAALGAQAASAAQVKVDKPTIMHTFTWKNPAELGKGIKEGGFSGLVHLPKDPATVFYTLADRGPNGEIETDGGKLRTFPIESYEPRIYKIELTSNGIKILKTIKLQLPAGKKNTVTGKSTLTGLSNIAGPDEKPYDETGTNELAYDPDGLDLEGIAYDPVRKEFWLSDEYRPSIVRVKLDGTVVERFVPHGDKTLLAGSQIPVKEWFPAIYQKRISNRGFEGVTISPDGKYLYVSIQSPMAVPDKKTGEASRYLRILKMDLKTKALVGEYVYQAEDAAAFKGVKQKDVVISDLSAISRDVILVDERDKNVGADAQIKRIYRIDLSKATNILKKPVSEKLESLSAADLKAAGVSPAPKTLVADVAKLGYPYEKLEGIAVVNNSIYLANDNDFGITYDENGKLAFTGTPTQIMELRLPKAPK